MIIQQQSNIAIKTIIQNPKHPYRAYTPLPSTRVVIPRLSDSSLFSLCSLPLLASAFPSFLLYNLVSMARSAALPLVMPGRFGVLCSPSPDSEGPFDQGTHCVTVIPKRVTLEEWAELIVACWEEGPFSYGWSPYRSVAVRYFDANDNPIVYREEYYHLAGDEGI